MNIELKRKPLNSLSQIILLCLFGFGLWLSEFPEWPVAFTAITVMTYFRKSSFWIMILATSWLWLFSNRLSWTSIDMIASHLQSPVTAESLAFRIILLAVSLTFSWLYVFYVSRFEWIREYALEVLLVFFLSLILFVLNIDWKYRIWLWGFILIFSKFFWYLAYSIKEASTRKKHLKVTEALTFFPFWSDQTVPIPEGSRSLRKNQAYNPEQLAFVQIKGLKLLFWSIFLKYCAEIIQTVSFGRQSPLSRLLSLPSLYLPDPVLNSISILVAPDSSTLTAWLVLISKSAIYLLSFGYYYGVIVAMARMAGFNIFRNMYNPLFAQSFPSFWRRTMYYYSQIVVSLFILPFQSKFKKIENKDLRFFLSCLLGIFIAALSFHFVRDSYQFGLLNPKDAGRMFLSQIPFYFATAFSISIFLLVSRELNVWKFIPFSAVLRPICYFLFAGLLWSLIFDFRYNGGSWQNYFKFLAILVGTKI